MAGGDEFGSQVGGVLSRRDNVGVEGLVEQEDLHGCVTAMPPAGFSRFCPKCCGLLRRGGRRLPWECSRLSSPGHVRPWHSKLADRHIVSTGRPAGPHPRTGTW